ncbi:hypothetical protein BB560_002370 [Smittium megazygosporum]|uniref:P/Homo B domain-containing protein n=1 Tax=Smittium megazygosporum TaxID=133381 RepID=A0A2T9ZF53_9FUNG|nr:hypothetical protein BB560_002368 [Smittium megazygosporum]PVV03167.1 hypothetical protein BB560_002370 [Smittium megazygosporum]
MKILFKTTLELIFSLSFLVLVLPNSIDSDFNFDISNLHHSQPQYFAKKAEIIANMEKAASSYRPLIPSTFKKGLERYDYKFFTAKFDSTDEKNAIEYAKGKNLTYFGRLGVLPDYFILGKNIVDTPLDKKDVDKHHLFFNKTLARQHGLVHFNPVQHNIPVSRRALITENDSFKRDWKDIVKIKDPEFPKQWHLLNSENPGNDINVTGVWEEGITGQGVVVALIDDGLDYTSEDLFLNFDFEGSYDLNDNTKLPTPRLSDDYHGTRCAGQIAARVNDVCGVGAAFGSRVAGIRMLSASVDEIIQVTAVNYNFQHNDIYSCSWGPNDDGATLMGPTQALSDAFIYGVEHGRSGKGSVFVFATGNGGRSHDNCNFDGYTNSVYTISVGAIDHLNNHPAYSESCSAQLAVTYSSSDAVKITTTDVGLNKCTSSHGGTSAAAPLAAGIIALALSVRPDLGWRDIQHLIINTAVPITLEDDDWDTVANNLKFNHKFGFGKMDAYALVQAAKTFKNLGPQTSIVASSESDLKLAIPEKGKKGPQGDHASSVISISKSMLEKANMKSLEHITVKLNVDHTLRGNMHIFLESPSGVKSELAPPRERDYSPEGFSDWTFMSVKHWGGLITGDWKLTIQNVLTEKHTGTFRNWTLTLFGESNKPGPTPQPPKTFDKSKIIQPEIIPDNMMDTGSLAKSPPISKPITPQGPTSGSSSDKSSYSEFFVGLTRAELPRGSYEQVPPQEAYEFFDLPKSVTSQSTELELQAVDHQGSSNSFDDEQN